MRKKRILSVICAGMLAAGAFFQSGVNVNAAITAITFETENYEINNGDEITIRVYLDSDTNIGAYHAEVSYDSYRLEYIGGGDSQKTGKVILEGTGYGENVVYKLTFKAISGGQAKISCVGADIRVEGADASKKQQVKTAENLSIVISGEDTAVAKENKQVYGVDSDIPLCGVVDTEDGSRYYIVDHFRYIPDAVDWDYYTTEGVYGDSTYTFLTNKEKSVKLLYLMDADEIFHMYAYSKDKDALYPCKRVISDNEAYYVMSVNVCDNWPENLTLDVIKSAGVCYAMTQNGSCGFYKYEDGDLTPWSEAEAEAYLDGQMDIFYTILLIAFVALVGLGIIAISISSYRKRLDRNAGEEGSEAPKKAEAKDYDIEFINSDENSQDTDKKNVSVEEKNQLTNRLKYWEKDERPVIAVKNVTMKFRISTSNASGIKEYAIQKLKRQASYKKFTALDHVSFNVYKGEIVGVIGTNGSGKSTILRIVSGALNPTSGKVYVDKKKVQLLTLGTGFDMELTARENIYLSGAIIGYTKEFIDENFDKIIEFAELQDFVDEKVKNFSSGMVSRLGFSIATIGDAAEILILDEVLSVGDEFFKKKSLKRVKEMIHGGSTVLMVSHGVTTIIDNCTKVIWIEKGKLKMIGEPRVVCAAYRKHNRQV